MASDARPSLFLSLRKKLAKTTPTPWKAANVYGCKKIGGGKRGHARQGQYRDIAYTVGPCAVCEAIRRAK